MNGCIIIRGPAGVGKTTIAKEIAKKIGAEYISFDKVMEDNELDEIVGDGIPAENFVKANELILPIIANKKNVVLDGCFYRQEQIKHLLKSLTSKVLIFTLCADVNECYERNIQRENPMSLDDINQVHKMVYNLKIGIEINTSKKKKDQIISELLAKINC
jgi:shikimate kinase